MTSKSGLAAAVFAICLASAPLLGQDLLTLPQALDLGTKNYGTIKARSYRTEGSREARSQVRRDYLPNLVLSGQQVYGTVNGQNGPLYGFGGFGVASSGLPLQAQNWNASFGALYLANINWEFFAFGRAQGRVKVATAALRVNETDLEQEKFEHEIRVAAAYLNVLAMQRLAGAQQRNLERARAVQRSVAARAHSGLVPGVDSAQANAEVAGAKIALIKALDSQQEETRKFAFLIGVDAEFRMDSAFVSDSPAADVSSDTVFRAHPVLNFYRSQVNQSLAQTELSRKSYFPSFSLIGVFQTRASGFKAQYTQDQTAFSQKYSDGVSPTRSNYLIGLGISWNLTSIARTSAQVKSLNYYTKAAGAEYDLVSEQLISQRHIADARYANALLIREAAPVQVRSATDAYSQRSALYRSGLTTMVEVTQSLYALNRAETDRDIAYINVWQALLLKAAALGDISLFTNELNK